MFSKSERGTNRLSEVPGSAKDAPHSLISGDLQVAGNLRFQSEKSELTAMSTATYSRIR